jgi:hypothetical protein
MAVKIKAKDLRKANKERTAMSKARANRGEDIEARAKEMGIRTKGYKRENIKFF